EKYGGQVIGGKSVFMEPYPFSTGQLCGYPVSFQGYLMISGRYFFLFMGEFGIKILKNRISVYFGNAYRHYGKSRNLPSVDVAKAFNGIYLVPISASPGPIYFRIGTKIDHPKRTTGR